jgi:hypothetical protein
MVSSLPKITPFEEKKKNPFPFSWSYQRPLMKSQEKL